MRLIILAAGRGERLWPLTKLVPKSLLEVADGRTVLDVQLDAARAAGIDEVFIVTGSHSNLIEDKINTIASHRPQILFTPYFDVSNNMHSLWMARWVMSGHDVLVLNGDTLVNPEVMKRLAQSEAPRVMTIDRKPAYDDEDMKVITRDGHVLQVSKGIPVDQCNGESIGLIRFAAGAVVQLVETLDDMVRKRQHRNVFWLAAVQQMIDTARTFDYLECAIDDWAEIDFHVDLEMVRDKVQDQSRLITDWLA